MERTLNQNYDCLYAFEYLFKRYSKDKIIIEINDYVQNYGLPKDKFSRELYELMGYSSLPYYFNKRQRDKLLNWCNKNLSSDQWKKLKTTVRQKRISYSKRGIKISINKEAYKKLYELSKSEGLTYSEVLVKYLDKKTTI